jgi:hypothetical protein
VKKKVKGYETLAEFLDEPVRFTAANNVSLVIHVPPLPVISEIQNSSQACSNDEPSSRSSPAAPVQSVQCETSETSNNVSSCELLKLFTLEREIHETRCDAPLFPESGLAHTVLSESVSQHGECDKKNAELQTI